MSKRGNIEFLCDIKEATERIVLFIAELNYGQFLQDIKTQDAIVRNFEIIGEAAKNISPEFKNKYKNIEWRKISGLRDKVIHNYFGVDWDIVWDVVKNRIPKLKMQIENILGEIENK